VSFQEVVHSVLTEEAEVAEASDSEGEPNGHPQECASDAVHVCIDDASRIAFSQVMKNEKKGCAVAFLKAAVAYYVSLGITVERVMTDNGACYKSIAFRKPASVFASSTSAPGPIRPRPTARPSASSKPACANGLMPKPTTPRKNALPSCQDGSIVTIGTVLMAV